MYTIECRHPLAYIDLSCWLAGWKLSLGFIPLRTDFSHKRGKNILILWRGQVLHSWKPIDGLLICCGDVISKGIPFNASGWFL